MRIHVVYEPDGKIIALADLDTQGGIGVRPLAQEGHEFTRIDVPDAYTGLPLSGLYERLRLEIRPEGPQAHWRQA